MNATVPELLRPQLQTVLQQLQGVLSLLSVELQRQAPRVLASSRFVREWCCRNPQAISGMLEGERPELVLDQAVEDFDRSLRRFRNKRMVHIAWQELCGAVSAEETVSRLSDLADECLQQSVQWHLPRLKARHGTPRDAAGDEVQFCIIALGKLGGHELNFSSDVDVIFAYRDNGQTDGDKALSNEQFFIRLGQKIVASMDTRSEHGFVFRVDLRLRPFGEQSPIAHALVSLEDYYEAHGREWERYAWIKARVCAGDVDTGEALIASLQPFVYRRYLDFGAIAALRDMKAQIDEQVRKRGHEQDVKLGWGGIREVEFIVQVFQLVRGGAEAQLRSNSLMAAMQMIETLGLHTPEQIQLLRNAYWFLRRVENCWQAQKDQQSHVLPNNEEPRLALACALGFQTWGELDTELQKHRAVVHAQFAELFAQDDGEGSSDEWLAWWNGKADHAPAEFCSDQLHAMRDKAVRWLTQDEDREAFGELLGRIVPSLLDEQTALRVLAVLDVIIGRGNYVSLLLDSPVARRHLIQLCQRSAWLAQEMKQFPVVLAELLDPIRLYAPAERAELRARLRQNLAALPEDDIEARMDVIRRTRHTAMLRIAAAEASAALPIMRVSDRLTELAEEILDAAMGEAIAQMRQRYPDLGDPQFVVIAYGKLGGLELSYSSDLDVVFVYDQKQQDLPLDPQVFYTRLAQKLIHFLATPTGAGMAYEIDTRLRPSGQSGLLVTTIQSLASYQHEKAWTWEHQALIRARAVVGSESLREEFEALRAEVLAKPRDRDGLLQEVSEMREKMHQSLAPKDDSFHPKHSLGGLVDIEFLTQFAVLAHAASQPQLRWFTDVVRILEQLTKLGLVDKTDAAYLAEAYRQLRAITHQRFLSGTDDDDEVDGVNPQDVAESVARVQQQLMLH
ncbi:MAG: bifunctional [glutamate--ammonia ligase]-adenylyl-L-tyrosine phosphorylase/[glutamate--ammonia-ligase] adenylyltransferase [Oceanococcus sp.]